MNSSSGGPIDPRVPRQCRHPSHGRGPRFASDGIRLEAAVALPAPGHPEENANQRGGKEPHDRVTRRHKCPTFDDGSRQVQQSLSGRSQSPPTRGPLFHNHSKRFGRHGLDPSLGRRRRNADQPLRGGATSESFNRRANSRAKNASRSLTYGSGDSGCGTAGRHNARYASRARSRPATTAGSRECFSTSAETRSSVDSRV